ncbi:MAG: aminotransferase class III-fold pyridoxal phosphate-dependent enzyme [Alphaproteobacteria bacterium]|nr:aminotransferase class III-fold pyridoxal phosphate-dependent enzyme [Alphaproteobacteria bacterium]
MGFAMSSLINCTGHRAVLPPITSAYREILFDADGNRYFDLEAGVWCLSLGHNHENIEALLAERRNCLLHSGYIYTADVVETAASRVCAFAGIPEGACLFLSSGSEAIEFALQVVGEIGQGGKVVTLPKAYFGSYSRTNQRDGRWLELPWSMDDFRDGHREIPQRPAAFLFEPGSASGEVRFPDASYVRFLAEEIQSKGGLVVANEITTGAGRTGANCCYEHYGIRPDIVVMGKGIGNGFPVSAIVVNKDIAMELEASPFKYMQSHQNDPLSAMIALCVIETIETEGLAAKASEKGRALLDLLKPLEKIDSVRQVRGRGLMLAIEFNSKDVCARVHSELVGSGFVTTNRGVMIRIDPPLNVDPDTLDRFATRLAELSRS